ncbi:TetR/AcrR family transcriptional regulator [Umezawaea tangerina]|uniref:TetR family transcriptional regulator n=1 Tax=Umezawaea tangerina TaxID=84725 RepID=A0A2T0T3Z3_9PSEU|nr:TetR/AcrR family transcriptional regulator [Umezawaea tangerina]PRY40382.1 TetR family transcriptional regulator [Umezawaea tangerina]
MTSRGSTNESPRPPGRPVDATLGPAIIEAVLDELAEGGYARLTTASVAKRAGVSTATLYRRWPTKRDLLLAAAQQVADSETHDIDTGSLDGDLRELLTRKQLPMAGKAGATLIALLAESRHDPELAELINTGVITPMHAHLTTMLNRAITRGEAPPTATPTTATRLLGGLVLAQAAFTPQANGPLATPNINTDVALLRTAFTTQPE